MENIKLPPASKKNSAYNKVKILRSKSKGIYAHQRIPKLQQKNAIRQKIQEINCNNNIINTNGFNKNKNIIELNLLKEEKEELTKVLNQQDELLKHLYNNFINNYTQIIDLRKKYIEIKKFLMNSLINENESIKEKIEEELALKAVEQQIIDELCPNPDKMSYEQLLELEEGLGNVNKGLSKDKINRIPEKPFHKALFDDNIQCIICMEEFNENELVKQLHCRHIFHTDCINHWLSSQKNCPFCKAECGNFL